jgi:hypothetical protein
MKSATALAKMFGTSKIIEKKSEPALTTEVTKSDQVNCNTFPGLN